MEIVEPRRFRKLVGELRPAEVAGETGRVGLEAELLVMMSRQVGGLRNQEAATGVVARDS